MELTREKILENRAAWCAALRLTGDRAFKQATGQLAREHYVSGDRSYCCLGVVCEVVGPAYGVLRSEYDAEHYYYTITAGESTEEYVYDDDRATLDTSLDGPLLEALGLNEEMQNFLIKCNDNFKFSFAEIAEVVESLPVDGFDGDDAHFFDDDMFEESDRLPEHLRAKIAEYRAES